ncbi:nucleotidyl transferase AbiEii/AbiGii toxin family protein [Catenulispora pinistramenti]|uniref:nucleotidyl transferase AbiEii/AbiGii toxin family protein n=1 Tax=Catenulispora pinistramenti TaxID=2705254 RepID=UPI001E4FE69A|nr:nucleotidyl transferase AbiEii/AbiGii toxin family protein [Catenulispora pinistramenti]
MAFPGSSTPLARQLGVAFPDASGVDPCGHGTAAVGGGVPPATGHGWAGCIRARLRKAATDAVVAAYVADGLTADVEQCTEYYVRLQVADSNTGDESKVELVLDIRLNPVVRLAVGTVLVAVLHPDDIAGGKIGALFDRAECRDFIDVAALLRSGRYSRERLLEMAAERDAGFDPEYFADMLRTVHRFDDEEFARYGVAPGQAAEIKKLADEWRSALRPPS